MSEKDHIVDQPCTDGDESTKNKSVGYETTIQSSDATTVCERCQGSVDKLIESVNHVARVKVHALEHKLQDFEQEAMYEFEELQSELLVAQARTEGLRQLLEDSERRRCQEQKLKQELEMQLLRLSGEVMELCHESESPCRSPRKAHYTWGDQILSRTSSSGLPEQPGTPEQREYIAPKSESSESTEMSLRQLAEAGMQDMALALAQLREDFRLVTEELVSKKMELAMNEEKMLKMVKASRQSQQSSLGAFWKK